MKNNIKINSYIVPRIIGPTRGIGATGQVYDPAERYRRLDNLDADAQYISDISSKMGKRACATEGCAFTTGPLERLLSQSDVYLAFNPYWRNSFWEDEKLLANEGDGSYLDRPDLAVRVSPVYTGWISSDAHCDRGARDCGDGINVACDAVSQLGQNTYHREYEVIEIESDELSRRNREALVRAADDLGMYGYYIAAYVNPLYLGRYLEDGDLDNPYSTFEEIRRWKSN